MATGLDSIAAVLPSGRRRIPGWRLRRARCRGRERYATSPIRSPSPIGMCVHPGFRRRGFGRAILARLEHRAGELRLPAASARHTRCPDRGAAICMYSADYREVGRGQVRRRRGHLLREGARLIRPAVVRTAYSAVDPIRSLTPRRAGDQRRIAVRARREAPPCRPGPLIRAVPA